MKTTNRPFNRRKKVDQAQRKLLAIWLTILLLMLFIGAFSQSIVKRNEKGQFQHISPARDSISYVPTKEIFVDSKGEKYTVYGTKNGKYFVLRTSKKTGKKYREYLRLLN